MRKLLILGMLSLTTVLFGQYQLDSLLYMNNSDTTYVKFSELQEKIIDHELLPGQTLYALSKYYGMSVNQIYDYNPGLNRSSYKEGVQINIPIPTRSILMQIPQGHNPNDYMVVCYVVKKSDTLYKLSKNYFGIPMGLLATMNQLEDNTLSLGQVLHIGWLSRKGIAATDRKIKGGPVDKKNLLLGKRYARAAENKREYKQKGVAYWQKDGVKSVDLYAMHRKAPVGSIIEIKNPMLKRTVYAKVIARIPEAIYSDDVVVVVSTRVAKLLGGKDARFFVKMKYLR
ncbi:MAG: LysM peptidoglycan-binding domain-containing protein [Saprospiraceae bacterium]